MEKLPEFNKELEEAVMTVMQYFFGCDDAGAFFIQLLISPDGESESVAVERLYSTMKQQFGENIKSAEEVINAFKVIRKHAISNPKMKKELEKQVQFLIEASVIRDKFNKDS